MLHKKRKLFLSVLLIVVLSACNLPSSQSNDSGAENTEEVVSDLALTVTAQAILLQPTATSEFTATPGPSFTPENTATPSVPQVTVSTDTNCRVGPGIIYDRVGALVVGQTAEVVGKNSSVQNYWVIKTPNGSGTCWLWGEYATVSGNTANLPEYPVPPTPTPTKTATPTATATVTPPSAITNLVAAKLCVPILPPNYQFGGVINWVDNSTNEDGFRILLNGAAHGTVGANITTYPIPPVVSAAPITLSVEAYNAGGKSTKVDVIITCP